MWTTTTSPFDGGGISGCCWAPDLEEFVAVGDSFDGSKAVIRSPDGIVWTYESSPFDAFGNGSAVVRSVVLGLYVAVGLSPDGTVSIITSPDGVTWTSRGTPFDVNQQTNTVACKQLTGALVAGSADNSGDNIATSSDGTTWTAVSSPFSAPNNGAFGIDYSPSGDSWIAGGLDSSLLPLVAKSTDDGATWTTIVTHPMTFISTGGVYRDEASGNWYLIGQTSTGKTIAVSSDDGATWAEVASPLDGGTAHAVIDIGAGVLGLAGTDGSSNQLCVSVDTGSTWTLDPIPSPFAAGSIALAFAYSPTLGRAVVGATVPGGTPRVLAYGLPGLELAGRVFIAFDDGPLEPSPTWTRVDDETGVNFPAQFVAGYDTHEGRQTLLSQTDTGTATVYINDHEQGLFDPRNSGSAYFDKLDGSQILLQLYDPVTGVWEPQFRGWIDFATYNIDGSSVDENGDPINASIQLECVDVFDILAEYGLTPGLDGITPRVVRAPAGTAGGPVPAGFEDGVYYAETVGTNDDRIIEVLADVGIDSTRYIVASGNTHLQAVKYDPDESALVAIRDACDADLPFIANCYCNRHGQLVFRGRNSRFYPDEVAAESGSEWDFTRWAVGDGKAIQADSTRAQMRVLSYTRGRQDVINVAISYPQGIQAADMPGQVFADTSSITAYGKHNAPPMSDLLVAADQSDTPTPLFDGNQLCAAYAELLVKNKKGPHVAVSALQVKTVHPDDARAATTWAFLTRSDISHVVNVAVGYPGGTGLTGASPADDHFIEGRSLVVRPLQGGFDYVELNVETTPVEWSSDFHNVFPNPFA